MRGYIHEYDITTGRGTIAPDDSLQSIGFEVARGTDLAVEQRVTFGIEQRAANVQPERIAQTPTVDSMGRRV
jgi:cold shock CspA family protein